MIRDGAHLNLVWSSSLSNALEKFARSYVLKHGVFSWRRTVVVKCCRCWLVILLANLLLSMKKPVRFPSFLLETSWRPLVLKFEHGGVARSNGDIFELCASLRLHHISIHRWHAGHRAIILKMLLTVATVLVVERRLTVSHLRFFYSAVGLTLDVTLRVDIFTVGYSIEVIVVLHQ